MVIVELRSGSKLKLYSGIKEMPVKVFNIMQGFLMQDTGIGSTMADVDKHFQKLDSFLSAGKIADAITERENLHYNLYAALEGISFASLAFACFVHRVDDEILEDYSPENLRSVLDRLSNEGLTIGMVEDQLDQLKKKSMTS